MYKLKQIPQDFIVRELSELPLDGKGRYAYYTLKKTSRNTVDALQTISKKFRIPLKNIGFAGNKDRNAVTEQKISILNGKKTFEDCKFENIGLGYLGRGAEPISLGSHDFNEFIITIRNLGAEELKRLEKFQAKNARIPNLFGPQRFSRNNHLVGKAIITKDFKKAAELILENNGIVENEMRNYLESNKNNYVSALRGIPLKTRKMFVHSYQSFLFNRTAEEYAKKSKGVKNEKIPLIGFGFEAESVKNKKLNGIIKKIMEDEKISPRDFITSQMPELASEGAERDLFITLDNFKVLETAIDDLNPGKKKAVITFRLPAGSYATTVIAAVAST